MIQNCDLDKSYQFQKPQTFNTMLWNATSELWSTDAFSESLSTSSEAGIAYPLNPYGDEHVVHTVVLVWTVVILVSGVLGNVLVIAAVWLHRSLRNKGRECL